MNSLKVEFLGTGTSQGIPVIGCSCDVCISSSKRDKRLRTSVLISYKEKNVIIDCGPDFRQQMLSSKCKKLDAVVLTHEHMDHIAGLDDVRPFNFKTKKDMSIFCTKRVETRLKEQFSYAFSSNKYPGSPGFSISNISHESNFKVAGQTWIPILGEHGTWPVLGFRINNFVYLTDVSAMTSNEFKKILGAKVLVVNALRKESHISHFSLDEALAFAKDSKIQRVFLTHLSHKMGLNAKINKVLPSGVSLAYDGLKIIIE